VDRKRGFELANPEFAGGLIEQILQGAERA
jgi:hypothetical protein